MTKYCRAPRCSNSAGQPRRDQRRLSFYKFPLHSPERLRQWLSQMNQEKWTPTKHQHLCSDHFAPSCFEYRWGVRYLKPDAVPTIFQTSDSPLKRENAVEPASDAPAKKALLEREGDTPTAAQTPACQEPSPMETLTIAIDPGVAATPVYLEAQTSAPDLDFQALSGPLVGTVNLLPLVQIVEPLQGVTLAVASPMPAVALPEPLEQQVVDLVASLPQAALGSLPGSSVGLAGQLCAEVAVPCEVVAAGDQTSVRAAMAEPAALAEEGALVIENVSIEPFLEGGGSSVALPDLQEPTATTEMVAYFETIPTAPVTAAAAASSGLTAPETVLSSALSLPIVSTLPIVSNHAAPKAPLSAEEATLEEGSSADSSEEPLEEHRYHHRGGEGGTTAELAEVVMGLQKKVKGLQQRHRRHCAKLEAMESVVEQLWKENLVSEEKLKVLEMACLQSSTFVPEAGGAVAIICQDREPALLYAVPQPSSEGNETTPQREGQ
ncbi:THAP domain-containing protein 8 [Notechis scutatus]|uniref:THAP domain-containing protein 8 n=1 Tax=Notechis scutatus TaxID=8663 RepID=A0A6J1VP86_9SAUR|nr:THAP domain-containing protein 8 [Notechis scutatus]